jgi:two-component system phosphate regulon response regulator OmpR
VLVVDDDPALRALLVEYLQASGMDVRAAADGHEMRRSLAEAPADVLVLDLVLPGEDGLTLAVALRRSSDLPILMLSARCDEVDRIVGLEVGADDYLTKPFSPRELLARLRALLRRSRSAAAAGRPDAAAPAHTGATPGTPVVPAALSFGPYTLDRGAHRLLRAGEEVPLTHGEYELLRVLVEHPLRVLSRDDLLQHLGSDGRDPFDRSIDVRVTRLRRKIERDASHPAFIRTLRGEGYLFNPRGEAP